MLERARPRCRLSWTLPGERSQYHRANMITFPASPSSRRGCRAIAIMYLASAARTASWVGRLLGTHWNAVSHVIEAVLNHYSGPRAGVAGIYNKSPDEWLQRCSPSLY